MKQIIKTLLIVTFLCVATLSAFSAAPTTNTIIALSKYSLNTNQFDVTALPLTITNLDASIIAGLGTNDITLQIINVTSNTILYSNYVNQVITNNILSTLSGDGGDFFLYTLSMFSINRSSSGTIAENLSHVGSASSAIGATANQPFGNDDTVVGNVAYYSGNTERYYDNLRRASFICAASTTASRRFWVGLSDEAGTSFTTILGSDAPAGRALVMFRSSTAVPDTHWKFVTQDGSSATVTDTGVSAAANTAAYFEMRFLGTSIVGLINGVPVATNTTTLPPSGTLLYSQFGIDALAGTPTFRAIQWKTLERNGF